MAVSGQAENMVWIAVALAALGGAAVVIFVLIRRFRDLDKRENKARGPVFTLEELGRLRREGQLSGAEYETLRNKIISEAGQSK